jgi:hypothetical protein
LENWASGLAPVEHSGPELRNDMLIKTAKRLQEKRGLLKVSKMWSQEEGWSVNNYAMSGEIRARRLPRFDSLHYIPKYFKYSHTTL